MIKLANNWNLRYRQEECHNKIIESYKKGNKEFLIAANCRFGKTITALQTLRDMAETEDQVIVVICTMSVKKEWIDGAEKTGFNTDLLSQEVNDIDFDSLSEEGRHIIYCSTQKLGNGSKASLDLIKWFNRHKGLKSLVYDECHLGAGTDRTQEEILERLNFDNKIYLSGTPYRKNLKKEFHLDLVDSEERTYFYTLTDERKDYKEGVITDYTPVQLEMHVLDYAKDIDSLVDENNKEAQKYGVSSAYFKKIFSEANYRSYAEEFLNKIIDFANLKNIKTFLFFVPLRKVGSDLVKNFAGEFKDRIEFRNLCGDYTADDRTESDDEKQAESEAAKLSAFYSERSDKIKIGITCNKCGTGTTLRGLDAVAFLKDTTQAIPFIQKSQRVRTPEEGKTAGYCLCFNQWQGLMAFKDYARAVSSNSGETSEKESVNNLIDNGAIKLVLNLEEVEDYSQIVDILNTYRPGQYPLFDDFDFDNWPDAFSFFSQKTLAKMKDDLAKDHPELRDNPDFNEAQTADDTKEALEKAGLKKEAEQILTEKDMRQLLEENYVNAIGNFYDIELNPDEIRDTDNYDKTLWKMVTIWFGTKEVWEYIIRAYPRYVTMVYNYFDKEINKQEA